MAADGIPNPFHTGFSLGAVLIEIPVAVLQNTSAKVEIGKQIHAHSVKAVFIVFVVEGGRAAAVYAFQLTPPPLKKIRSRFWVP